VIGERRNERENVNYINPPFIYNEKQKGLFTLYAVLSKEEYIQRM
jgi:hypothetical protein